MVNLIDPKIVHIRILEDTPIGSIGFARSSKGLIAIEFPENIDDLVEIIEMRLKESKVKIYISYKDKILLSTHKQLIEYFNGTRKEFNLPVDWSVMTQFQQKVLKATSKIPYGRTQTYGEIASQVGSPQAARAVGRAEATNPLPILIPCHRVVGADGNLRGYGGRGGIRTKEWLLILEGSLSQ